MQESPIFVRTFDMLAWLLPVTQKFPKEQRFALTARLQNAAFDFYEAITAASISKEKKFLQQADVELQRLRLYLRLCQRMQFFNKGQYEHVFKMVEEIGRLLGGWTKKA
ncbi:MAG: diversity-generating retroelement protein Avd [Anaerolineales bacterium]|jgi:four helix bundle protein|nr:diversity-generating retroelement protein Avd [Chloroflexota bacterium]MBK6648070.1 diversity-generating retroelement protein Avd [Anaerolineales bacterium]